MAPTTNLVPPRRLGVLLRDARVASGRELSDMRAACGLSVVELDDIEHGRHTLDEITLEAVITGYGIAGAGLVPERSRLVIDLDEGRIAVDHSDVDVNPVHGPDAVLTRYLALVYQLREMPLGTTVPLRDIDVEVLSSALSLPGDDVESRLGRLMVTGADVERDQRRIRRQLLLPLVGIVIAGAGAGTLLLVADDGDGVDPSPPVAESTDVVAPRIGTPAIEEAAGIATDLGRAAVVDDEPRP